MRIPVLATSIGLALLLPACRKPAEVTVNEERPLTMRDADPTLDATSAQRFGDGGSGSPAASTGPFLASTVPPGWVELPSNQFRLLNYRFGTSGEVFVGISVGGLTENVNRWLGQFGAPSLDEAGLAALEKGSLTGSEGVWVEAQGEFSPGMGQPPRGEQALYGIIAQDGPRILTVKMTGPVAEVAAQKDALKLFVSGLQLRAD